MLVRTRIRVTEIWAHRGSASRSRRENTLPAFAAARRLGADGIEVDVRCSADGVLVVHHDALLPSGRRIERTPAGILPRWLPTLAAALAACGELTVNVEIKATGGPVPKAPPPGREPVVPEAAADPAAVGDDAVARATARLCAASSEPGRFVISSFALPILDAVADEAPGLALAWLVFPGFGDEDPVATATSHGLAGIHPHHTMVDERLVATARSGGLRVRAWTVDDPDLVARLARIGVDAIITNDVGGARRALGTGLGRRR